MVYGRKDRNTPNRRKPPRFFELEGRVHRRIVINRGKDLIYAWDYQRQQQVTYSYTQAKKRMKPVFRTGEVAWILNRSRYSCHKAVWSGAIDKPVKGHYPPSTDTKGLFLWTEDDILRLLDYFSSIHRGRPRKDGIVNPPKGLPTPREVKAMIHEDNIMYVKQGDMFVPTWRAKEI